MTYTWEVTNDADQIIAWIKQDGYPVIRQLHHPQAVLVDGVGNWDSTSEAETWVSAEVTKMNKDIADGKAAAEAAAAQAEEDRQRLINIETMLKTLTGN